MGKKTVLLYALLICLITSLIYNYILYNDNKTFMIDLGVQYRTTVGFTLFELKEGATDFWITALKEDNGDVLLERHLGRLQQYTSEFNKMGNAADPISLMLYSIEDNYRTLTNQVNTGENVEELIQIIETRIHFIRTVLTKMVNDFGDNDKQWYTELSKYGSDTAKYVHDQYKQIIWKGK